MIYDQFHAIIEGRNLSNYSTFNVHFLYFIFMRNEDIEINTYKLFFTMNYNSVDRTTKNFFLACREQAKSFFKFLSYSVLFNKI